MRFRETTKPLLYEINTRVWLRELSLQRGHPLTLAEVPEEEFERLAELGVDLVWLMGVWQVGPQAVEIARTHPDLEREYRRVLPDFTPQDVIGSPYSVAEYSVDPNLGGTRSLLVFRSRLARRGIGLVLDFVSNHTGIDHPWVTRRPEYYVQGGPEDLEREPGCYFAVKSAAGPRVLAHGRDPYFPAWTDSAQFNFLSRSTRSALQNVLQAIAGQCDGVRCDMAMLALESVFRETWGTRPLRALGEPPAQGEFWSEAIASIRETHPRFLFLAEAYWGLEGRLQELGFDYAYDKTLYDLLLRGEARAIRDHLQSPGDPARSVRFLENHDEERAARAFPWDRHRAAALIARTVPGMALYHQGQLEGRKVKTPLQLGRRPEEPTDRQIQAFYRPLFEALKDRAFRSGRWCLLGTRPAWEGNPSWEDFLAYRWQEGQGEMRLIAVNFAGHRGQCYVELQIPSLEGKTVELVDLLGVDRYVRDGLELSRKGLYLDLPAYGLHLFRVDLH